MNGGEGRRVGFGEGSDPPSPLPSQTSNWFGVSSSSPPLPGQGPILLFFFFHFLCFFCLFLGRLSLGEGEGRLSPPPQTPNSSAASSKSLSLSLTKHSRVSVGDAHRCLQVGRHCFYKWFVQPRHSYIGSGSLQGRHNDGISYAQLVLWRQRARVCAVGGANSAREQDSSVGGDAGYVCLGAVHTEEEVQDRVQVEVGKRKVKERHTERNKARNREATRKNQPLIMDGVRMICAHYTDTFSGSS